MNDYIALAALPLLSHLSNSFMSEFGKGHFKMLGVQVICEIKSGFVSIGPSRLNMH